MEALPIIDLAAAASSPVPAAEPGRLAPAIDRACTGAGFFLVVNHGLERSAHRLFGLAEAFFALPQGVKERLGRSASFGYVPRRELALDRDRPNGVNEFLDLSLGPGFDVGLTEATSPLPGWPAAVADHLNRSLAVAARLLAAMAVALDQEPTFFARRMTNPECKLRLLHYWPAGDGPDGSVPVPTAPHTDYGALTLLATDGAPGLEILGDDGAWRPVEVPAGALVVNLGDMLARWTNLRYTSTRHRVVAPPVHRYSIPFFVNPDPDTVVDCLPSCVSAAEPCRHEPVTAAAFLAGRIAGTIPEPYL